MEVCHTANHYISALFLPHCPSLLFLSLIFYFLLNIQYYPSVCELILGECEQIVNYWPRFSSQLWEKMSYSFYISSRESTVWIWNVLALHSCPFQQECVQFCVCALSSQRVMCSQRETCSNFGIWRKAAGTSCWRFAVSSAVIFTLLRYSSCTLRQTFKY